MKITVVVDTDDYAAGNYGFKTHEFENIEDAGKAFPNIDPSGKNNKHFMCARDGGGLRFETWAVYRELST